jgi:hypothetical protein
MVSTPVANGSGDMISEAASRSPSAWESSSPAGCRWCQVSGRRWYCSASRSRRVAWTLACSVVAAMRRQTIPAVFTTPTAKIAQAAAMATATSKRPLSNRGVIARSITWPSTHDCPTVARAYTVAPATAIANGFGCRATCRAITRSPRRSRRP